MLTPRIWPLTPRGTLLFLVVVLLLIAAAAAPWLFALRRP
jgi:hypothetical protein